MDSQKNVKVAILDLYEGQANQGMSCIRELLTGYGRTHGLNLQYDEFEVRLQKQVPDLSYDIYISSGGPGSPLDSEGSDWEAAYWRWLRQVEDFNGNPRAGQPKQVLFICHSFQLICRHHHFAQVTHRKSTAFGVFPVHMLEGAVAEPVFAGLRDPFYAVDSRSYQVVQPDLEQLARHGGQVL